VLLTPEPRKETPFLDLDLALNLDRFPNFSRPRFMERVGEMAVVISRLAGLLKNKKCMNFYCQEHDQINGPPLPSRHIISTMVWA
jgi:hypothetical protein